MSNGRCHHGSRPPPPKCRNVNFLGVLGVGNDAVPHLKLNRYACPVFTAIGGFPCGFEPGSVSIFRRRSMVTRRCGDHDPRVQNYLLHSQTEELLYPRCLLIPRPRREIEPVRALGSTANPFGHCSLTSSRQFRSVGRFVNRTVAFKFLCSILGTTCHCT
jgi:hypothetical protein